MDISRKCWYCVLLIGGDSVDEQKKTSGSLALNGAPQVITIPPSDPVRDRKLRVAAYARVSSGSEDQLNSFAAQNAHYTELITDNPEWVSPAPGRKSGTTSNGCWRTAGVGGWIRSW